MVKLTLFTICFAFSLLPIYGLAQEHHIKRAEFLKPGQKLPNMRSQKLDWSAVDSECFETPTENGLWVELKTKTNSGTLIITSSKKPLLSTVTLYLGEIVQDNRGSRIKEVHCETINSSNQMDDKFTYEIGHNNFVKGKQYFVLIGTENSGTLFDIELSESYTEKPATELAIDRPYIQGKVTDENGRPKSGAMLTMLSSTKKPLKSTTTKSDGSFQFQKLPVDEAILVRLDETDHNLRVDLFLMEKDGKILSKATRIGTSLFGFEAAKDDFSELILLSEKDWKIKVPLGKKGIVGRVVDKSTFLAGQEGIEIELLSKQHTTINTSKTDSRGVFEFNNLEQGEYSIRITGDQTNNYSELVMLDDLDVPTEYSNSDMANSDGLFEFNKLPAEVIELNRMVERDTRLSILDDQLAIEDEESFVLKSLLFETGSATIKSESYGDLDNLASQLILIPDVKLEINGHTDNQGDKQSNLELSKNRAKAVTDYLVSKGVPNSRLTYKGFGDMKPIASNNTDAGRKKNRRVEFIKIN